MITFGILSYFSMGNTNHRTMPTNICTMENPCDLQPNITTNTTNLINININNAGNITTVASGENHQINKSYRYDIDLYHNTLTESM